MLLVPCSLYCIGVSISAIYIRKLEWYTRKPRMYDETHKIYIALMRYLCSRFLVRFTVFGYQYQQTYILELEWYTGKPRMYDETHIALITKYCLYTHGSLFTLPYLSININRCIQKPEWYKSKPKIFDETYQIQVAMITKCDLYAHGSLFALLYLGVNISRRT